MSDAISIISDVHVKESGDDAYLLMMDFLKHPKVQSSPKIYLLGDIFDLMVGCHKEYLENYKDYFCLLGELLKKGHEIHYFQGNHDIYVEQNYRDYFRQNHIKDLLFVYHDKPFVTKMWGKTFLFAHGDEIEIGNWIYKIYKAIISTSVIKFMAENILSYQFIHGIFGRVSKSSRENNLKYDPKIIGESFRLAAKKQALNGYDYIICGHSHVKEDYIHRSSESSNFTYLNNGYALDSKTFIHFEDGRYSFVKLSDDDSNPFF
ncbi:MAG: UDP-2,3-diacylglucosamine diphosphatase [Bacteriovoracales bacterium]|nr:UDP-2,3-diacylglucosamine diphosphatase [Bacteriovoracales bacterium]